MKKLSREDAEFLGEINPGLLKGPGIKSHAVLITIVIIICIAIFWAKTAVLDEVVRGAGKVIPSKQIQTIQNLEGGIVKKILVSEGMVVNKGQPLIIIDDTRFKSSYKENQIKENSLEIRLKRLTAEYENIPFVYAKTTNKAEADAYRFEFALYQSRQEEFKELVNSYNLSLQELKMTEPLVQKGAASPVEVLQLKRAVSDLKGKINKYSSATLDELNKVKAELDRLKETNLADLDRLERTIVRSPTKGIVKTLKVYTEGGVVQPGNDLMDIVPLDDTLLVEAKVRPKDIGFLKQEQPASVTISAFDFTIYGALSGTVESISPDAITSEDGKETYYLIRVRTKQNYLGSTEKPLYIIPGMQAQVDIQTGEKTVLDYILNPIMKTLKRALREK